MANKYTACNIANCEACNNTDQVHWIVAVGQPFKLFSVVASEENLLKQLRESFPAGDAVWYAREPRFASVSTPHHIKYFTESRYEKA